MMRSRSNPDSFDEPLDPAIQAELDQLDAALRGDPITDDELAALVREVQATAPEMPADLRKRLRHEVADGFAKDGVRGKVSAAFGRTGSRAAAGDAPRRRPSLAFGGGLAATVLVMSAVGVAVLGTGDRFAGSDDMASSQTAAETSMAPAPTDGDLSTFSRESEADSVASATEGPTSASGGDSTQSLSGLTDEQQALAEKTLEAQPGTDNPTPSSRDAAPSTPAGATPPTGTRRVEQAVEMTVRVKNGELDDATRKVETIVRQGDGYVADSQVSLRSRGAGTADYTLKVASSKLDATMKRLADLGTVTRQEQASRDITSSFDSVNEQLEDRKRTRAALLKALDKATDPQKIGALRGDLADNRASRQRLENQLARLKTRTNLTDVTLTLSAASSTAADPDDDGSWSLGDAASDAVSALSAITGVLLVGAAILLPFAVLAVIGWAVYRVRRRRARESTLD